MKPLTARRARFVEEYLVDLNPRAAAVRAGYKAEGWRYGGYALLKVPEVAAAIRDAMDARARRLELSADLVVRELMALAFSDIRRIAAWRALPPPLKAEAAAMAAGDDPPPSSYEVQLKDSGDIDEASARAIASLRQTASGAPSIRLHDKLPALLLLGRHLGLFGARADSHALALEDRREAEMDAHVARLTPEQRTALRAAIVAAVRAGSSV